MTSITQQQIAERLGISLKTVQRAFNQPATVSAKLRQKILTYAGEHGYRPNRSARALHGRGRRRIALVTAAAPAYFWDDVASGLELAAQQITPLGYEVEYRRAHDQAAFMAALDDLVLAGVDCLSLVNHTTIDMRQVLDWVGERQVPFAAFNVDFVGEDRICFLGSNFVRHGELAGELVVKLMRDGGTVALLTASYVAGTFLSGADIQEQRRKGIRSVTDTSERIQVVDIPIIEHGVPVDGNQVLEVIEHLSGAHRMVLCIAPFPDYLIAAIESGRFAGKLEFLGFDLSPRIAQLVQGGAITAEIFQNPMLQGYGIVKLMETFVETGTRPPRDQYVITPQIIFRGNVDQRSNVEIIAEISAPLFSPAVLTP